MNCFSQADQLFKCLNEILIGECDRDREAPMIGRLAEADGPRVLVGRSAKSLAPTRLGRATFTSLLSCLKEGGGREDALGQGGADRKHRLIHDLAQAQMHRHAAKEIGVDVAETPSLSEKIDHSQSGDASGGNGVRRRLDDDPGVAFEVRFAAGCGFDERTCERLALVELEAQGHVGRALDAVDADLAIALRGVGIAGGEESAVVEDRKIKGGAGAELADIHVAAKDARRPGAKLARLGGSHAHDAAKGTQRHDRGFE